MTPDDLRKEASATEFLAGVVSYGPDKARLHARAQELRSWAEALESAGIETERLRGQSALKHVLLSTPKRSRPR